MKFQPVYAEKIIVGVISSSDWSWFVGEAETWILNQEKFAKAFSSDHQESGNWESHVVVNSFLQQHKDEKVAISELSAFLLKKIPASSWDDLIECCPSLYINFDQKVLKSLFPENIRFEEFVPQSWNGSYEDFLLEIPSSQRYWVIDEIDYFQPFLNSNSRLNIENS